MYHSVIPYGVEQIVHLHPRAMEKARENVVVGTGRCADPFSRAEQTFPRAVGDLAESTVRKADLAECLPVFVMKV